MPDVAARTTRLLLTTRFIRSIGQGALAVDLTLYLRALDWSAVAISSVLSAALLFGVVLTLIAGPLSDRGGRRRFLFVYEAAQCLAGVAAALSAQPMILWAAALVGGFGRGGNGSAGPFAPVEQAWLAQVLTPARRGPVYSLNAALGFLGNAAGAVIAALPSVLHRVLPGAFAYRPLFLLSAIGSLLCCALILRTPDTESRTAAPDPPSPRQDRQENRLMLRLMIANIMNGAGIGATGPLIAYWFAVRFGEGPAEIGPLLAAGFLMAAVASVGTGYPSRWLGVVRAVVAMRLVGLGAVDRPALRTELRGGGGAVCVARDVQSRHHRRARRPECQHRPCPAARLRGQHGECVDAGASGGQSRADRVFVRGG
jgi:predicted MFS family arabinose efflux permease